MPLKKDLKIVVGILLDFMAEQATQLYIKAIILETGGEYPRTHSIRELIVMLGFLTNRKSNLIEEHLHFSKVHILIHGT
jgi:HEPN domain-containing protein